MRAHGRRAPRLFTSARTIALCSAAALSLLQPRGLLAQAREYAGRSRYTEGRVSAHAAVGPTRYTGEFTGHVSGYQCSLAGMYAITPTIELGAQADVGRSSYERRARYNTSSMYDYQFGALSRALRHTRYLTVEAQLRLHLFPAMRFDAYLLGGAGRTWFRAEDYGSGDARYRFGRDGAAWSIPVGLGLLFHVTRTLSVELQARNVFLATGEFDAFASEDLRTQYDRNLGLPGNPDQADTPGDTYLGVTLGIRIAFGGGTLDSDADGLRNAEEEAAGTNPWDPDTDGDGVTDEAELRRYGTDPLRRDSDGDILSDFQEIAKYGTDPLRADTDADGLGDRAEVLLHLTDPLAADTEGDGLPDAVERRIGSDPKRMDTDGDGLTDGEEVNRYGTSPVLPDSDGEGLDDYRELHVHGTDPNAADTDGDGLNDYVEIVQTGTDARSTDTDNDGASDYEEMRQRGSDPLLPQRHVPLPR